MIVIGIGNPSTRQNKGNSLIEILSDYVAIDIETTGLDPRFDDIIEVAAIRVRNGVEVTTFQSLVNPGYVIDDFITELTGITNDMLSTAPEISRVLPDFLDFIGSDTLIGHNVNFDVNFLYDASESLDFTLSNDFIDTMRISRRLFPEEPHHRLKDLHEKFGIEIGGAHRALVDCRICIGCYDKLIEHMQANNISPESLLPKSKYSPRAADISATNDQFDASHPFYGKVCVFTGALERMVRREAMQLVVNLGGICADGVTAKTNFLILGNNDYCASIKDGKSSKQKKAETYMLKGYDIQILSENAFYDMLEE